MRKRKVCSKAKGFLVLEVSAAAHIATAAGFGQGSVLGGHHASKGGGNSGCGRKPHFFKLLTLQHFLNASVMVCAEMFEQLFLCCIIICALILLLQSKRSRHVINTTAARVILA